MEHGKDNNSMLLDYIENLVGESPYQCSMKILVHHWKLLRVAEYGMKRGIDVQQKPRSQSRNTLSYQSKALGISVSASGRKTSASVTPDSGYALERYPRAILSRD